MKDDKFEVGDVVQLKSGGVPMTVSSNIAYGVCSCSWFDSNQELHQETFPRDSIGGSFACLIAYVSTTAQPLNQNAK